MPMLSIKYSHLKIRHVTKFILMDFWGKLLLELISLTHKAESTVNIALLVCNIIPAALLTQRDTIRPTGVR